MHLIRVPGFSPVPLDYNLAQLTYLFPVFTLQILSFLGIRLTWDCDKTGMVLRLSG